MKSSNVFFIVSSVYVAQVVPATFALGMGVVMLCAQLYFVSKGD